MNDPEPPTAQATLERARAALAVGRYTDAVAGLRALADGGGATAREAGLLLGRALRASGDAAGAIPVLQDVLNSTSATGDAEGAARALSQLASISDTLSAPDDAATLYAEALTLSPTLTEAVTGLPACTPRRAASTMPVRSWKPRSPGARMRPVFWSHSAPYWPKAVRRRMPRPRSPAPSRSSQISARPIPTSATCCATRAEPKRPSGTMRSRLNTCLRVPPVTHGRG